MVDRDRIEHVFDNLIVNAIQHTQPGRDRSASAAIADGDRARFVVRDNGEGIPREHVPRHLREVLSRPDRAGMPAARGWAWRSSARSSRLTAARSTSTSEPGKGTTFTFTLPAAGAADESTSLEGGNQWTQRSAS